MSELAGRLAVVKVPGTAVVMTAEATTTTDDITYQITNAVKQVLDRTATITVKDGGVATSEAYTLNRLNGTVTFETKDETRVITIDGKYLPMSAAAGAHQYNYNKSVELHDVTAFLATHKARIAGQKWAAGTLSSWDINDYFSDALTAGDPVVLEFRGQTAGEPERVWALLESSEMAAAIADAQSETVTFISTDELLNL